MKLDLDGLDGILRDVRPVPSAPAVMVPPDPEPSVSLREVSQSLARPVAGGALAMFLALALPGAGVAVAAVSLGLAAHTPKSAPSVPFTGEVVALEAQPGEPDPIEASGEVGPEHSAQDGVGEAEPPEEPSAPRSWTVGFGFDSAVPLDGLERIDCDGVLVVTGHTCATGPEEVNLAVGLARAEAVRSALIALGASPETVVARSAGEAEPVASNETAAGRAANRRAEITCHPQFIQE